MFTPTHSGVDIDTLIFLKNRITVGCFCCISYERQGEGGPQTLLQTL